MLEELGAEIADVRLRGVLENLFTWDARPWHEIVILFDATLRTPRCTRGTISWPRGTP
jgi:hypothetical protein